MIRPLLLALVMLASAARAEDPQRKCQTEQAQAVVDIAHRLFVLEQGTHDRAATTPLYQQVVDAKLTPEALGEVMNEMVNCTYGLACDRAVAGDVEHALLHLERAVAFGFDLADWMGKDDDLKSLRDAPRFGELVKLAAGRAAEHHETGTLLHLYDRPDVVIAFGEQDRLGLLVPATKACRERVLALACTPEQRKQLDGLAEGKRGVEITGSGGMASTAFTFTVATIRELPAIPPAPKAPAK